MFLVVAFCLGLRGEEVVKMDIAGFMTYFEAGLLGSCESASHDSFAGYEVPSSLLPEDDFV
jgi:hypothetical protein